MGQALHAFGIDSMSIAAKLLQLSAAEKAELDRRLTEDDATPDDTVAWEKSKPKLK